ncbi:MAG TPA: tyrosinase family protein [Thermoanaerobaculia bacterium]|nr:tyrosinase family protein [Thermoanaerobaculia bacterium]
MAVRTRRDVWKLGEWDDILLWYAKAIGEMLKRPLADPTGFRYQAAIHEYVRSQDPLRKSSDRLPSSGDQRKFWSQCQHNSWFFIPWHRWYLLYYEEIVAAAVVKLGGPAGWALPYWNYSDASNPDARRLPPAFRAPTLPDGSPNPLRANIVRQRGNDGEIVAGPQHVDLSCLKEPRYQADPTGGSPGFGGPKTAFNHGGGPVGAVELTPHGSMHVRVGGWMGRFNTAGLDPLFWLHHCNIDRLWSVWTAMDPTHTNPADSAWSGMSFAFHDGTGAAVTKKIGDTIDTAALGYEYEDLSNPFEAGLESLERPRRRTVPERPIPEMVGASERPVALGRRRAATAHVPVTAPAGPGLESVGGDDEPQRIFVNVENVTGDGDPRTYAVYVNGEFAGVLPTFGVPEATQGSETHPGGGLQFRFDVTDAVRRLQAAGNFDESTMEVTFVPEEDDEPGLEGIGGDEGPDESEFQIGRVSVYRS